ncbi:MAG: hypothetical protein RLO52_12620 [Sandaracinaceae bacterium]|nr:MAG: hypothetical protein EVA89_38625 [Sandaracinaceae bacterium]
MNRLAVLGLLCLSGCSAEHLVALDLRTDLVVLEEIDQFTIFLDEVEVARGGLEDGDYAAGVRIAELDRVVQGPHRVRVEVSFQGTRVATQVLAVQVTGPQVFTVLITRDCRGVDCGAGPLARACLGAMCVEPECTPETPEACPEAECAADADCGSELACVAAICQEGRCLATDDGSCGPSAFCDPDFGCRATRDVPTVPLEVLVSNTPDRAAPSPLQNARLSGEVFIFVPDQPHLAEVRFRLDQRPLGLDPQVVRAPPWDLSPPGPSGEPTPLDTSLLWDGFHSFHVEVDHHTGGDASLSGTFTVAGAREGFFWSTSQQRTELAPLDGATVTGDVYVVWAPGPRDDVTEVELFLDDPGFTGPPTGTEQRAPYDLLGTDDGPYAFPRRLETDMLAPTEHEVTARVSRESGAEVVSATFTVAR